MTRQHRFTNESESARKARQINEAAWKIINSEKATRDEKTAKLKALREAADEAAPKPVKKAKNGKR